MRSHREYAGPFTDRAEAGRVLAARLAPLHRPDAVVLGLPRGGVPVAAEVARALDAPLDIVVVRKIGAPRNPELAIGAAGEDGVVVRNSEVLRSLGVDDATFEQLASRATNEVAERSTRLRGERRRIDVAGRSAIVVDDGVATGATAEAAIDVLRAHGASEVIVAVPVATPDAVARLMGSADEVVAVDTPTNLGAVGAWYSDFRQVSDAEVVGLLGPGREPKAPGE